MSIAFVKALTAITPAARCIRLTWDEQMEIGRARNAKLLWCEGSAGVKERGYRLSAAQTSAAVRRAEDEALAAILARRHEEGRP